MSEQRRQRILNVDDNEAGRYAVSKILTRAGFEVIEAATGQDALRLVATQPDLVLLDVNLPDIDGFEVCARIKADPATAGIPVVHLSASFVASDDRAEGLERGADAYLTHPVDPRVLTATLRATLRLRDLEHKLHENSELLRAVVESSSDAIYVKDLEGRYVFLNRAAEVVTGMSAGEMLGHEAGLLPPSNEATAVMESDQTLLQSGKTVSIEEQMTAASGEVRSYLTIKGPLFDTQGQPHALYGVARDITERKRAEEALRTSEDKFSKAFYESPDAILLARASDGLITEVNEGFVGLSGFARDEAIGATTIELGLWADPRDRDRMVSALQAEGNVRELEFDFRVRSGASLQCLLAGAIITVEGEPHILVVVRDVTQQRQMEADVRRSEALLRGILDNLQDAYVRTDLEGRVVMVSPSAARLYGFDSVDEMIGLPAVSLYADLTEREAMFEELRLRGHVVDYVGRGLRKDGGIIWVSLNARFYRDEAGSVAGTEGFIRDITERVRAEDELQQSRALFQTAMDQSQAGIAIADAPDGRLRYVNRAGLFIRGRSSAEVVDQVDAAKYVASWQILHHDGTPYAADEVPLARAVLYGETSEAEFIIKRDDDDDRLVSARAAPIRDAHGAVTAGVVVFDDITERKQIEQELRESESRYRELVHAMSSAVVVYEATPDGRDFVIREFNQAAETIEHVAASDVTGRLVTDAFPGVEAFGLLEVLRKVHATGSPMHYPAALYADEHLTG